MASSKQTRQSSQSGAFAGASKISAAFPVVGVAGNRPRPQHGRPSEGAVGYGNDQEDPGEEECLQDQLPIAQGEARCQEAGEKDRQEVGGRPVAAVRRVPTMAPAARISDYSETGRM